MDVDDTTRWVNLATAAQLLGMGVATAHVQARVHRGSLHGERIPDVSWRVLASDIQRVLDAVDTKFG